MCFRTSFASTCPTITAECVEHCSSERNLRAYIVERHSEQMPNVMVWGAIGYNMRSPLLRIQGSLNGIRYFRA